MALKYGITFSELDLIHVISKIRKVSTCRPAVSNETIIPTRQEFFFTNVAPVQRISDIVLLDFSINAGLLNDYFVLHYHLLFCKKIVFSNVHISVNTCFLVEKEATN